MIHHIEFENVEQKLAHLSSLESIPSINPVAYDEDSEYQKMDFIEHGTFGAGFVEEVVSNHEIRVFFPVGEKLLTQKKYLVKTIN
jgi:hypothetical protein